MPKNRGWGALLAIVALLQGLLSFTVATPAVADTRIPPAPFADVYSTKYQDAVGLLYLLKVASGTGPYTFSPHEPVTRAQMAAFLLRTLGEPIPDTATVTFSDVPNSYWARAIISRAAELGLIKGDGAGRFRPEAPVTYAEVATMLIRALGYESQVPAGDWPVNYVLEANQIGLLAGADFSAMDPATRGEVAILLANAIFKVKEAATGQPLNARVFQAVASLSISPASGVLTATQVQLNLMGTDWFNNTFPVSGTWSVQSNNANITASGLLTVTGPGSVSVKATRGDLVATQTFTRVQSLAVGPSGLRVPVGGTVRFSATGTGEGNQTVPVSVTWTATGAGTIDPNSGVLTVTGSGPITVTANAAGLTATASVTGVGSLAISPQNVVASMGKTIQFTLTGDGAAVDGPVRWSILSGGGSLTSTGEYTPGNTGHVVIQAAAGSLTATAEFDVVTGLRIQPSTAALGLGTTQQFTAQVQTDSGWQTVDNVQWSLSNNNIGVLSNTGLLATTGSGTATITARYGLLSATSTVTVAGPAVALRLSSNRTMLPANGSSTTTLTATFVDASGIPTVAPVSQVLFTMTDTGLGSLSAYAVPVSNNQATVTFTSGSTPKTGYIGVTAPGSSVLSANLLMTTMAPMPSAIKLSAYPSPIAADGYSQSTITATLIDQDGQPMTNNTGSSISVLLGMSGNAGLLISSNINIVPGTQSGSVAFRAAATPGTSTITGSSSYPVTATQIAAVTVGQAAKLNIRTPIADTPADGSKQMQVTVEIQDASGNVVTGDNTDMVSLTVTGPANITPGSLRVTGGTATFKFTATKAGTYTLVATSATNVGLVSARATANFTAGSPAALSLTLDPKVDAVTADGVTAVRLVAKVLDTYGNLVSNATTPITFMQNTSTVFRNFGTQTVNAISGVATISITPTTNVGSDQFAVSAPGLTGASLTVPTRITGGAYKVVVQAPSPLTVTSGQTVTVSVWAEDSAGHVVTNDSGRPIALVLSDPNATSNSPQTTVNGVATFTVTGASSGVLVIKAQSAGLVSDNVGQAVTVNSAPPDHIVLKASASGLAADGTSTVVITPQLVDSSGNPATGTAAVTLSVSDASIGSLAATQVGANNGVTFTASTKPGTVTITGVSQYPVVPVTLKTYIAGPPTRVVVDPPQSVPAGNSGNSLMQVTVRVTDDAGNTVTSLNSGAAYGGGTLSVAYLTVTTSSGGGTTSLSNTASYPLPPGVVAPNAVTTGGAWLSHGVATFTFSDTKAETVTFTPALSIGNRLLTPVSATGTITAGPAASVAVTSSPAAVNALTGGLVTVTANVVDAFGNPIPDDGDTFTFALNSNLYLTPINGLTATATGNGASITLQSRSSTSGVTLITATSAKTGLMSAPYAMVQDFQPDKPSVTVTSVNGSANFYATDAAIRVTLYFNSRLVTQTATVYVNGVQVPLYSDISAITRVGAAAPGTTTLSGYVLRGDYGGAGSKTVTVVLSDAVGTGLVSDPVSITVN